MEIRPAIFLPTSSQYPSSEETQKDWILAYEAVSEGDLNALNELSSKGIDLKVLNAEGFSLLYVAALKGHLRCVEYLLEKELDPNAQGKSGFSPVYAAAEGGHPNCLWRLLEKGGEPNIVSSKNGATPAHAAARSGLNGNHLECLKVLAEYRANLDQPDNSGKTPLDYAKEAGHKERQEFLSAHV